MKTHFFSHFSVNTKLYNVDLHVLNYFVMFFVFCMVFFVFRHSSGLHHDTFGVRPC